MIDLYNLSLSRTIGLSIYRVVLSFLVIKNIIFYLPLADSLFGPAAIFPYRDYIMLTHVYRVGFLGYLFSSIFQTQAILCMALFFAILFFFGIYKRTVGVALFISIFILKLRNGFILDGSDNVIQVTLPFLILADSYNYFYYRWSGIDLKFFQKPAIREITQSIKSLATIGLMVQVCFVYFFTALAKLQGDLWLNGTAIYYTMRVDEFRATDWNIPLTRNHYFVVLGTYFTIFWELAFTFLVWTKPVKYILLFFGILLHAGIWIFMRIDNFSWIMIGCYFVFISNDEYAAFFGWLDQKAQAMKRLLSAPKAIIIRLLSFKAITKE